MEDYLTVKQVAEKLHVSQRTVYRAIHLGQIPAIRVIKQLRVHPSHLKADSALIERSPKTVGR